MSELIQHVSDANFEHDVLAAGKPVLVDFWAEWCGPCKMFAPILDDVAREYEGRLTIAKLDIDHNQETPGRYGIRGVGDRLAIHLQDDVGWPNARARGRASGHDVSHHRATAAIGEIQLAPHRGREIAQRDPEPALARAGRGGPLRVPVGFERRHGNRKRLATAAADDFDRHARARLGS